MAMLLMKTKFSLEDVVEQCIESEDDITEEESDVSSDDSIMEEMFLNGGDVTLNKYMFYCIL